MAERFVGKVEIKLYPELISAAFLNQEWDLYFIWTMLKALDKETTGRGIVSVKGVIELIEIVFGVQKKQAYAKLNKGIDKYWRIPHGEKGKRKIGLYNWESVIHHLSPTMPRCSCYKIKLEDCCPHNSCSLNVKAIFVGVVAARLGEGRPQSLASIMEHTGLCKSTVRSLLNRCDLIDTKPNYIVIKEALNDEEAKAYQRRLMKNGHKKYRILYGDNCSIVAQLPNSYSFDANRLSIRQRPKALSVFDQRNADSCDVKKYNEKKAGPLYLKHNLQPSNLGSIALWQAIETPEIPVKIYTVNSRYISRCE